MVIKLKVEYHREGMFYTVRGKRLRDLNSLKDMRERIMMVKNAVWKWHVVLTFDPKSLYHYFRSYGDVGVALSDYFDKVRGKFWGVKYFWKYEEGQKVWCIACDKKVDFIYVVGREGWVICEECGKEIKGGDLPHFHLLYDFVNRGVRCRLDNVVKTLKKIKKVKVKQTPKGKLMLLEWVEKELKVLPMKKLIFPKNWSVFDWKKWEKDQRKYENNKNKTLLELLVGYYHFKKWGNGLVLARKIRNYMDLKKYVKKDFFKYTEAKYLKGGKRKWTNSLNLLYEKGGEVSEGWVMVLETIGKFEPEEALVMVMRSKENMIEYYDGRGQIGKYIYKRVIDDIKGFIVVKKQKIIKVKEKVQERFDVW